MARGLKKENNGKGKRLATQQSVDQAIKSICDFIRRGNCTGAMQADFLAQSYEYIDENTGGSTTP